MVLYGPPIVLLSWAAAVAVFGTTQFVQVLGLTLTALSVWFHGRRYERDDPR